MAARLKKFRSNCHFSIVVDKLHNLQNVVVTERQVRCVGSTVLLKLQSSQDHTRTAQVLEVFLRVGGSDILRRPRKAKSWYGDSLLKCPM